jgi:ubiquinone/menaquinone biosynthesis C-methylase UbiE
MRDYRVWHESEAISYYLNTIRGAVPLAAEQVDVMLRLLRANGRPVRRFLDLGCGDGFLAAAVLAEWPAARAVLMDFAQPMLEAAQSKLGSTGADVVILQGDYADPSWLGLLEGEAPFDAIVSGFSIHHQPDDLKKRIYREIFSLLAPGGIFVNIEHCSSATPWVEQLHDARMIDCQYEAAVRAGSGQTREQVERRFKERQDQQANILSPAEDQCQWLREIGFQDVDCYLKIFELAVFGGRKANAHK